VQQAIGLLQALEAFEPSGRVSRIGRDMARLPMHPRLSRMLIAAASRGCVDRACLWAALISERDILIRSVKHEFAQKLPQGPRSDLLVLEAAYSSAEQFQFDAERCASRGINASAAREVSRTHRLFLDLARQLAPGSSRKQPQTSLISDICQCLLVGF